MAISSAGKLKKDCLQHRVYGSKAWAQEEKKKTAPSRRKGKKIRIARRNEDRAGQTANQQTHGGSGLKAALYPNARLD